MRDGYIRLFPLNKDNFKLSKTGKYIYKMTDITYAELLEDDTVKIFRDGEPVITSRKFTLGDTFAIFNYPKTNKTTKSESPINFTKIPRELNILIGKENPKSFKVTFL